MLEMSGFHVFPVNMNEVDGLAKNEMIPFLMKGLTDSIR